MYVLLKNTCISQKVINISIFLSNLHPFLLLLLTAQMWVKLTNAKPKVTASTGQPISSGTGNTLCWGTYARVPLRGSYRYNAARNGPGAFLIAQAWSVPLGGESPHCMSLRFAALWVWCRSRTQLWPHMHELTSQFTTNFTGAIPNMWWIRPTHQYCNMLFFNNARPNFARFWAQLPTTIIKGSASCRITPKSTVCQKHFVVWDQRVSCFN